MKRKRNDHASDEVRERPFQKREELLNECLVTLIHFNREFMVDISDLRIYRLAEKLHDGDKIINITSMMQNAVKTSSYISYEQICDSI